LRYDILHSDRDFDNIAVLVDVILEVNEFPRASICDSKYAVAISLCGKREDLFAIANIPAIIGFWLIKDVAGGNVKIALARLLVDNPCVTSGSVVRTNFQVGLIVLL